ncbi:hypothetical protein SAMN05216436_10834 [bacterium A37T11]|nr:hypothetical protein SAMN05216436_10834 [bacterium A37T11]
MCFGGVIYILYEFDKMFPDFLNGLKKAIKRIKRKGLIYSFDAWHKYCETFENSFFSFVTEI